MVSANFHSFSHSRYQELEQDGKLILLVCLDHYVLSDSVNVLQLDRLFFHLS